MPGWSSLVLGIWRMGYVPRCFFVWSTECWVVRTTGSIWQYSNLPSCLASASTVRNQGIRALVRRAVMRDFESYSGVSHEPAQSLNLRIDSGNHINTCSSIIVLTFLSLPIILWIARIFSKGSNLNTRGFRCRSLHHTRHTPYIPVRTMDSTWIVQIDPRFIPRELFGTMGKCSLSPNCCCTPLKIQLISLLPFIRVWVITVTHTAFSLLGARSIFISTLYLTFILPSFFIFGLCPLFDSSRQSLLARLEGRLTKVDSESRLSIPPQW